MSGAAWAAARIAKATHATAKFAKAKLAEDECAKVTFAEGQCAKDDANFMKLKGLTSQMQNLH